MNDSSADMTAKDAWNTASDAYNAGRPDVVPSVSFGPLCPADDELRLLGDLALSTVLDVGCGGGQNALRLAMLGAAVTAVDISERQLEHARRSAAARETKISFLLGKAETLSGIPDRSQDLILAVNVMPYVKRVDQALASCRRVLKPGGRLVLSMDHPFRSCFVDVEAAGLTNYPERDYFCSWPRTWPLAETTALLTNFDRTVGEWVDLIHTAGLILVRLLEPQVPDDVLDELYPVDGPLASLRNIPHTLICVARAPSELHPTG